MNRTRTALAAGVIASALAAATAAYAGPIPMGGATPLMYDPATVQVCTDGVQLAVGTPNNGNDRVLGVPMRALVTPGAPPLVPPPAQAVGQSIAPVGQVRGGHTFGLAQLRFAIPVPVNAPVTAYFWDGAGWAFVAPQGQPRLRASNCSLAAAANPAAGQGCLGFALTQAPGTAGDDTIVGTPGDDVIAAGPGDDHVDGQGGNDRICGGSGNDTLVGGDDYDGVDGGPGNDRLDGGPMSDRLAGDAGFDRCRNGEFAASPLGFPFGCP